MLPALLLQCRRGLFLAALFVLGTLPAAAQAWQWAIQTQAAAYQSWAGATSTVLDAQGNAFVAGVFADSVRFGPALRRTPRSPFSGTAPEGAFVTKLSPTGQWLWTATSSLPPTINSYGGNVQAYRLTPTPAGGVVVAGMFIDSAQFGAIHLSAPHRQCGEATFMAQLSALGQWEWAVALTNESCINQGAAVTTDAAGNVLVAGLLLDSVQFGTTQLIPRGRSDAFVAKLSPTGQWLWATQAASLDSVGYAYETGGIATDPATGTVYVAGSIGAAAVFGADTVAAPGGLHGYVAALSPTGTWQWALPVPAYYASVNDLARDPATGELLVGGRFAVAATFGTTTLRATTPADSSVEQYVARFDPAARAWRWAAAIHTPFTHDEGAVVVAPGAGGTTYVGGQIGAYLNPGQVQTATFGAQTLTGFGASDGFVARLSAQGQWREVLLLGGPRWDYVGGLAVEPVTDAVTVVGRFGGPTLTFGTTVLTTGAVLNFPGAEAFAARGTFAPLGLPASAAAAAFRLFPNPAHHTVTLTGAPGPTAEIIDALGRVVLTSHLEPLTSHLDLTGLPAGLYVVRCGGVARRLVVE